MKNKILNLLIILVLVLLVSCSDNDDNGQIVVDEVGSVEYFINNKTTKDLVLIFEKSEELGSEIDTTRVISSDISLLILEDSVIGQNPVPEDSLEEIKIYEASNLSDPLSTFSPVNNEDWTITSQELGDYGFGLTSYEIIITDSILD
ncbi:hypothetical protein pgond44_10186 [Psychroflexus gondwanensis ACAM 44]|uniref:Lipoprotein n=1 Tax=Psychroflexus gondwanensis ACAM 44 TaxID=1189619 RepID=N1WUQ2_9FLAO|nr:hypothetical protein [Psychroflexus gondwanensis]EMY80922.1 hypothetical protein pgond44_10186 [Psychroflexus gondwanensis ACAM 44]